MRKVFSVLIMLLFAPFAKGQSVQDVEDTMLYYIANINRLDTTYGTDGKFDSLDVYDKRLLDYLTIELVKLPATLTYDFSKLKNTGIGILTSDDNIFRIYYWDIGGGAGSHSCDVLVQYNNMKSVNVKVLSDVSKMDEFTVSSGLSYGDLITQQTKIGKTIYLATGFQKIAAGLYGYSIQAFAINDSLDTSIKIFKTPKKLLNSIEYCIEASRFNDNHPWIKISDDKQKIYIPVVTEEGEVTSKFLVYVFDGNNYVFDKNAK